MNEEAEQNLPWFPWILFTTPGLLCFVFWPLMLAAVLFVVGFIPKKKSNSK